MKRFIKKYLNLAITLIGPHKWTYKEPTLLVLMYHRILPKSDSRYKTEQPGMLVTPESLDLQLDTLKQYFEPIHLNDWLTRKKNNLPLPNKSIAITFDDGWADNYEYAFPLLKKHNIPATIFLVTNLIDTNKTFWPERLVSTITAIAEKDLSLFSLDSSQWLHQLNVQYNFNAQPTTEELDEIINSAKRYSDKEINKLIDGLTNDIDLAVAADILSWEQINEMKQSSLVEFGSHTKNHTRMLNELNSDVLDDELVGSQASLATTLNTDIPLFCYPNGDMTRAAEKIVSEHYLAAVTTKRGWVNKNSNFYQLPRIGIHDDISNTKSAFLARLSGWL